MSDIIERAERSANEFCADSSSNLPDDTLAWVEHCRKLENENKELIAENQRLKMYRARIEGINK